MGRRCRGASPCLWLLCGRAFPRAVTGVHPRPDFRGVGPAACADQLRPHADPRTGWRVCQQACAGLSGSSLDTYPMGCRCSCSLRLTAVPECVLRVKKLYESIIKHVIGVSGHGMGGYICTGMVLLAFCEADHAPGNTAVKTGVCADIRGVRLINRQQCRQRNRINANSRKVSKVIQLARCYQCAGTDRHGVDDGHRFRLRRT